MGESDQQAAELVAVGESKESQTLRKLLDGGKYKKYGRFVFAALSSIPWIGGLIGASAAMHAELEQGQVFAGCCSCSTGSRSRNQRT